MTTTPAVATQTTVTTSAFSVVITSTTPVQHPAADVWAALSDTASYPQWNPLVTSFVGPLTVGEKVAVVLQLPGRKPQPMAPTIVAVEPGRSFTWLGRIGFRGVFDGRHHFEVRPTSDTTCELVQHERLSGALVPFFKTMLTGPTPAGFEALNEALKQRVERG